MCCAGYQHYEFSVVKELAEPATKLAEETGSKGKEELTDQILFDFNDELGGESESKREKGKGDANGSEQSVSGNANKGSSDLDLLDPSNASQMLEDLLKLDLSPETENAQDALDLGLGGLGGKENEAGTEKNNDKSGAATSSLINIGSFKSKGTYLF